MRNVTTFGELEIGDLFTLRKSRIVFEKRPVTTDDKNRMFNAHSGLTGRMFFLDGLPVVWIDVDLEAVEAPEGIAA